MPGSILVVTFDTSTGIRTGRLVGSTLLEDGAVLSGKIGSGQVASGHLTATLIASIEAGVADEGVTSAKLASGAVIGDRIADAGIFSGKIASGAIGPSTLLANAIIVSAKIASGIIAGVHIKDSSILSGEIGPLAVGTPHIAANAITSGKVASGGLPPLTSGKIWAGYTGNVAREEDKPAAEVGGLYGINVETLEAAKTLTSGTDEIYQYLDEGGAHRIITLDTASATAGDRFIIRHNGLWNDGHYLEVKQSTTSLGKIYTGGIKEFIFNGDDWVEAANASGDASGKCRAVGIGLQANAYTDGVAVGYAADGHSSGVSVGYLSAGYTDGIAIGRSAMGYSYGVGIGRSADGASYGVALGYQTDTNLKRYSIALGYYSETERTAETSINIDGQTTQNNNVVQGRWAKTTTDATPIEMFLGARANQRFTIRASSALAFTMLIVARDNVANEVARYSVSDGLIKRDAAGNTTMVNCTVVTDYEDDAAWDVAVTADDTNEALIITVIGDADNPVQWAAVMDGVETHF